VTGFEPGAVTRFDVLARFDGGGGADRVGSIAACAFRAVAARLRCMNESNCM
jgi:hypothetical protein